MIATAYMVFAGASVNAETGFHWEGDFPLFIQGILMIILSGLTLWLTLEGTRKQSAQDDAHEEQMAELMVKALKDQHIIDIDSQKKEGE